MSKKFAGRKGATTKEGKKEEEKWWQWIQVYCNQVYNLQSYLFWMGYGFDYTNIYFVFIPKYSIMLTLQETVAHAFKISILVSCLLFNIEVICHISSNWNFKYCTFLFPVMKRRKKMRVTERQRTQPWTVCQQPSNTK